MITIIKTTRRAVVHLSGMKTYLENEFSEKAAQNLMESVDGTVKKIISRPSRGRQILNKPHVKFINIDKHRQMFYSVRATTLTILDFFDTRQDPSKRPF